MDGLAIATLGLKVLGNIFDYKAQRDQAKAQGEAMRQQAINAIRTMNYAFMNFEEERRDSFEESVGTLMKNTLNARSIESSVRSAVGESSADSRTGRLLTRSTHADTLRNASQIQDNYRRKSNEIDLNKEQQMINTRSYIEGLHPPQMPSRMGLLFNIASTVLQDYTKNQELSANKYASTGKSENRYTGRARNGEPFQGKARVSYSGGMVGVGTREYGLNVNQMNHGVFAGNYRQTPANGFFDNPLSHYEWGR